MTESTNEVVLTYGYKSDLEKAICEHLKSRDADYEYAAQEFRYTVPATKEYYTPDIVFKRTGVNVEFKGRLTAADRKRLLLVRAQHPKLDLRLVFSDSSLKLTKGGKVTYSEWCEKHNFAYTDAAIPEAWIREIPPAGSKIKSN